MCTRQSRKEMRDMINTLFLTTVAVKPTFITFLQHLQTHFHGLSCQFFQVSLKKKRTQNHPQCLSRLLCALFPTAFLEIAVYSGQWWIFNSPLHGLGKQPPLATFASVNNCYLYKCMCFLWHEEKVLQPKFLFF